MPWLKRFERSREALASRYTFAWRMGVAVGLWLALALAGLTIGMAGYAYFEGMAPADAYVERRHDPVRHGPGGRSEDHAGKVFAGSYAIFSGLIIVIASGLRARADLSSRLAPLPHRERERQLASGCQHSGKRCFNSRCKPDGACLAWHKTGPAWAGRESSSALSGAARLRCNGVAPGNPVRTMSTDDHTTGHERLTATWIELAIRLGVLGLLLYLAFILVHPFITIAIWSVVLTVALYPAYDRVVGWLGGRRRLAAALLTIINLMIVIGPAAWLVLGLIDSIQDLSARLDLSHLKVPEPSESVKSWPLVGEPIYQFWELAATNLQAALVRMAPQLKPVGSRLLAIAADAGTGAIKFLIALVITGFLFPPAPAMVDALRRFSRRLASAQGETFVKIAGSTIRAVARGVIGISALQAFLVGVGVGVAGIPAATLITSMALVLGIIQIGPSIIVIPLIIWSWTAMETTSALLLPPT